MARTRKTPGLSAFGKMGTGKMSKKPTKIPGKKLKALGRARGRF